MLGAWSVWDTREYADENTIDKEKDNYSVTTPNSAIKRGKINNPLSSFITTKGYNIFITNEVHSNKFLVNTDLELV